MKPAARTEDGATFHIYVGCTQPDKRSMELAGVKPVEIDIANNLYKANYYL